MGWFYENKLYNEPLKRAYLKTLPPQTAEVVLYAFYRSFNTEEVVEMDLYDFNAALIEQVLWDSNSKSIDGVRTTFAYMKGYIDWAIGHGYRRSNVNPCLFIYTNKEHLEQYLSNVKLYLSKREIDMLLKTLRNAQDRVIVQLAFYEGVKMRELLGLTIDDVDFQTGEITLPKRTITVQPSSLDFIQKAYDEKTYERYDKERQDKLARSRFILRNALTAKTINTKNITKDIIFSRLTAIRKAYHFEDFTFNSLIKSGKLHDGFCFWQQDGKLTNEHCAKIAEKIWCEKDDLEWLFLLQYVRS